MPLLLLFAVRPAISVKLDTGTSLLLMWSLQQQRDVAAKAAESKRHAAKALEAVVAAAAAFKPVRPAMASRTEASITLNLVKKGTAQVGPCSPPSIPCLGKKNPKMLAL